MIVSRFQKLVERTNYIRQRPLLAHSVAVALIFCATLTRLEIGDSLRGYPFLTFFPAVTLAVFIGGFAPGLTAAILGGYLSVYYFVEPIGEFYLPWPSGWIAMIFYVMTVGIILGLTTGLLKALDKLKINEALLELRVKERTEALSLEMAERSKAEAQMRQMQKMEAVGQLTGGIAHDFNNMLAVIMSAAERAKRRLTGAEHPQIDVCLAAISEAGGRAAKLVARLLAFSRQQSLQPEDLNINKLISGMSDLLHRSLGEHIQIEIVLGAGLWHAYIDPSQFENAVLNLAVNARDAMPEGGKLTIETANVYLDEAYAEAQTEVKAGQYVMISVSDTGIGMDRPTIEKAFDPFFTTKEVGKGTGLGLSQVFGYVRQSAGHIKMYSEIGQGTSVKMYFPRLLGVVPQTDVSRSETTSSLAVGSKEIVVLIVEDDFQMRASAVASVRELGYTVKEAGTPKEALRLLEVEDVHLLFTDVVMPEMSGRQLAQAAKSTKPALKVLFTTGYTRNAIVHNGVLDPDVVLLPKPYTLHALAAKLAEALK